MTTSDDIRAELVRHPAGKKKKKLTLNQKRDIRDGIALAMSSIGTAISVAAFAMTLSPKNDPEGIALADDLAGYFGELAPSLGTDRRTMLRAISTADGCRHMITAVNAVGSGREAWRLVRELNKRMRVLRWNRSSRS